MVDCLAQFRTVCLYAPRPPARAVESSGPFSPTLSGEPRRPFENKASIDSWATAEAGRISAEIRAYKTAGTFRPIHHRPRRFANASQPGPGHSDTADFGPLVRVTSVRRDPMDDHTSESNA